MQRNGGHQHLYRVILEHRVRPLNDAPLRTAGAEYVLYWCQMNRRVASNHALLYAVEKANELGLPVLVYEGLTYSYPSANDRIHTFVVANVPETQQALDALGIGYCFYLRQRPEDPNDVVYQLASRAALVVTDDYPTFIASWHNSSVPAKLGLAYHAVDSSCIIPMNRFEKREWAAYSMRPKVKRMLADHLAPVPPPRPLHRWTAPRPPWHVEVTADPLHPALHCVPRRPSRSRAIPATVPRRPAQPLRSRQELPVQPSHQRAFALPALRHDQLAGGRLGGGRLCR